MDYRIDRWGGCKAYHVTAMRMGDVDPSAPMLQFIAKRLNLTLNQKFWLAWLYSTCYSAPAAFYMLCNLDRNLTQSEVVLWWKSHKEKMKFGNDRIYVKNRDEFPKCMKPISDLCLAANIEHFQGTEKPIQRKPIMRYSTP